MGKVEICTKFPCDPFVLGELLADVGRQHICPGRETRQQLDRGIGDELGGLESKTLAIRE